MWFYKISDSMSYFMAQRDIKLRTMVSLTYKNLRTVTHCCIPIISVVKTKLNLENLVT